MPETLASEKNPLLKEVRRAIARGSLTDDGLAVAEGFHLFEEALRSRDAVHTRDVSLTRGGRELHLAIMATPLRREGGGIAAEYYLLITSAVE